MNESDVQADPNRSANQMLTTMKRRKLSDAVVGLVAANRVSTPVQHVVVPFLIFSVFKKDNYHTVVGATLNRAPVQVPGDDALPGGRVLGPESIIEFNTFLPMVEFVPPCATKIALFASSYTKPETKVSRDTWRVGVFMQNPVGLHNPKEFYSAYIAGTKLANTPTAASILRAYPDESMKVQYKKGRFMLPLSEENLGNTPFSQVTIIHEDSDDPRTFVSKSKDPLSTQMVPSVTMRTTGDKYTNGLYVEYHYRDESVRPVLVKYGYMPSVWSSCFGVCDPDAWQKTGSRFLFGARDFYAIGEATLDRIQTMVSTGDVMSNDCPFDLSDAFISGLKVDLPSTVRGIGIKIPDAYVLSQMMGTSSASDRRVQKRGPGVPEVVEPENSLNRGWKAKLENNEPFILNVTEMKEFTRNEFIKYMNTTVPPPVPIEFYGVFSTEYETPYEFVTENGNGPALVSWLESNRHIKPPVIFAVSPVKSV